MKNKKQYYIYQMNVNALNIGSILLMIIMVLLTYLIDKEFLTESANYLYSGLHFVIFIILYIFYMILHELLHSVSYVLMGAIFKNIVYGAALEKGVLYCLCKENVTKKNILVSLLTPFFLIGLMTFVVSILLNMPYLFWLSIFNISGTAGDIIMFIFISKLKDIEFSEFDDPISFAIHSNNDITNIKHYGLDYIKKTTTISRTDLNKVNISNFSKYFFIGLILILIVLIFISKYC